MELGKAYVLVDDFVGQGGMLANLRGYILKQKGRVAAALTLTGRPYSAKLSPTDERLNELREKHGIMEALDSNDIGTVFERGCSGASNRMPNLSTLNWQK